MCHSVGKQFVCLCVLTAGRSSSCSLTCGLDSSKVGGGEGRREGGLCPGSAYLSLHTAFFSLP